MKLRPKLLAIACLYLGVNAFAQSVCKSKDANGRTTYADCAQSSTRAETVPIFSTDANSGAKAAKQEYDKTHYTYLEIRQQERDAEEAERIAINKIRAQKEAVKQENAKWQQARKQERALADGARAAAQAQAQAQAQANNPRPVFVNGGTACILVGSQVQC